MALQNGCPQAGIEVSVNLYMWIYVNLHKLVSQGKWIARHGTTKWLSTSWDRSVWIYVNLHPEHFELIMAWAWWACLQLYILNRLWEEKNGLKKPQVSSLTMCAWHILYLANQSHYLCLRCHTKMVELGLWIWIRSNLQSRHCGLLTIWQNVNCELEVNQLNGRRLSGSVCFLPSFKKRPAKCWGKGGWAW